MGTGELLNALPSHAGYFPSKDIGAFVQERSEIVSQELRAARQALDNSAQEPPKPLEAWIEKKRAVSEGANGGRGVSAADAASIDANARSAAQDVSQGADGHPPESDVPLEQPIGA